MTLDLSTINLSDVMTNGVNTSVSLGDYCQLNQIALLNQLEKVPQTAFWLFISALIAFGLYGYVLPRFKDKSWGPHLEVGSFQAGLSLLVFGIMLQAAITFAIPESVWNDAVTALGIFTALIVLYRLWQNRKGIISKIKEIQEQLKKETEEETKVEVKPDDTERKD